MHANTITTSFHKDSIQLNLEGRTITISHLPLWVTTEKVMLRMVDSKNRCVCQDVRKIVLPYPYLLPELPDGIYSFHLLYRSLTDRNLYIGLNTANGFPIRVLDGHVTTIISRPFEANKRIFMDLSTDFVKKHDRTMVAFSRFIPSAIIELAHKIVRHSYSNYDRILAVHDWVAGNIYYDYDSIEDDSYKHQNHDALSVLTRKRTVCQGYSQLTTALLQAAGVHAVNMDCFALGLSTDGGWEKFTNMIDKANHVITFAYADDRWMMLDTTWDSDNEYRNGVFLHKSGYGVSHQYFDCTLAFFSYTHRFIK